MPERRIAECHPDRRHWARGMCGSCYQGWWKRNNPEKFASRPRRRAKCHPDEPVLSLDLCNKCYRRYWRENNLERGRKYAREYQRRRAASLTPRQRYERVIKKYGLTLEQFSAMVIAQRGSCAACTVPTSDLEVDHCHARGKHHVRGLLCHNCNSALGHAKDDVERLQGLIDYLVHTA